MSDNRKCFKDKVEKIIVKFIADDCETCGWYEQCKSICDLEDGTFYEGIFKR